MTLMEALIAVFIFAIVFLTALMLFQAANRAYLQTDAAAIQQQNVRFGMDRMLETLRDTGAGFNTLGSAKVADEQIEGAWESAIFVRGNFNNKRENTLENTTTAGGFPIVTTGNDEIVGYVLRKNGTGTIPITIKADLTGAGALAGKRDAVYTNQTTIALEETSTSIMVAATTVAQQLDPPYQLTKVTFNSSGTPQYEVIADNIYRMKFEYYGATGATIASTAVLTPAAGSGSADNERDERAAVRRIKVKLIGMADRPDFNYVDRWHYGADFSDLQNNTLKSNYHKFALQETILATNMGIIGRKHNPTPALSLTPPTYITACTGHCRYFHIRWPASTGTAITEYSLRITAPAANGYGVFDSGDLAITGGALEYVFKESDTTGFRTYTFKVASAYGGVTGTYGSSVSLQSAHDVSNSTPNAPSGITSTQTAGSNALIVGWTPVTTNTGTLPTNSNCATAGTGGTATQPSTSWPTSAVDLSKYNVYRLRDYGGGANGNFAADAAHQIDTTSITTLINTTPGVSARSFTDHTAAPCESYFYRVEACDLCDIKGLSAAMGSSISGADPGENPDAPGGASAASAVTGNTTIAGNDYNVVLSWPAVVQTVSGVPTATAHYRIYRFRAIAPSTTYVRETGPGLPIEVYEPGTNGVGVAALTYTDTPPAKVTGDDASYQYYVAAVYSSCGREGALAGPYTAISCNSSNTVTINSPAAGIEISIPFESGFTPNVTVNNEAAGTVSSATATLTGPSPSTNVVWYSTVYPNRATLATFDFGLFDTAPQQAVGTYSLNVYATVNNCNTAVVSQPVILGDATCGLNATNVTLTPTTGNPKFTELSFNVQNTCDAAQGGLNFTVTGITLSWTGYGGSRTITEVRLGSPTGTLMTATPLALSTGQPISFLSSMYQTVDAGTTSANKWYVLFNGEMKQNASNNTSFGPITAQTTTPANASDIIVACCQSY